VIFLDTHVVVWLYAGLVEKLSAKAAAEIEANEICLSQIVRLELQYLYEIGRVKRQAPAVLNDLERRLGVKLLQSISDEVIEIALRLNWTRDPFDRLIVAEAHKEKAILISKDSTILGNYGKAVW
jgi:PIN domain nuclease of toxin-antitoxin system|tara:strand:+ start:322 stop:696 length:375 start_codon:yes stop_codon:yes gene_type:complete